MSWAAHQFEVYAVAAHLPKKMRGKVSFWGIWLGDFTPDFLSKFWVYGITIKGKHYGASVPQRWHRGWPGMGFTHTLFLGIILGAALWAWTGPPGGSAASCSRTLASWRWAASRCGSGPRWSGG